ncbi:MAG: carboxypeptidase M32 [Chloroflexota bacterium]
MTNKEKYDLLVARLAEVSDLIRAAGVLGWDQQVYMPRGGMTARGNQLATLSNLAHARATSPEIGELLSDLAAWEKELPYESDEASMIRIARREYERETKLPADLVREITLAANDGYAAWLQAREAKDFSIFRPALERVYRAMLAKAQALGYQDQPLNAFVDEVEPGVTLAEVDALFAELKSALVPLVAAIRERLDRVDETVARKFYDKDAQWKIGLEAVRAIGFDLDKRGRADISVHPFTTSFSPDDVRITTRIREREFTMAFYAFLHEAGHGTYEQGLPKHLERSVLCQGASGGMHESQSRLWENIVGRSHEFCEFFYPTMQRYFPEQTAGVSLDTFYGAVNAVHPSFIRTEADEVTYNLHIMIRTELEREVFAGRLAIADLEQAWNEKYKEYLGIVPSDPVEGVLQDIHWSGGFGAAFISYTFGNVIMVQLYQAACREIPGLQAGFRKGEFAPLLHWMNQHVHAHGAKFKPLELVRMATGADLSAKPYLEYIRSKFSAIYGL